MMMKLFEIIANQCNSKRFMKSFLINIGILIILNSCNMSTTPKYGRQFLPEMYFSGNDLRIAQSIYNGDTTLVKQIPASEVNKVNDKGICFLIYSIYVYNERAMEILLEKGADPNIYCEVRPNLIDYQEDTTPLSNAADWPKSLSFVKILLSYHANINDNRTTPALLCAVGRRNREVVDYLLDKGANVNIQHAVTKNNALIEAADLHDWNMVNHLLDRGADPMLRDISGDCLAYTIQFQINRNRGTDKYKKTLQDLKKRLEGMGVVFPVEKIPPKDDDTSFEPQQPAPSQPPTKTPPPVQPVQSQNPKKKTWSIFFDDDETV